MKTAGDVGREKRHFQQVSHHKGDEPLLLGRVLFPLRYDIFVQEQFLRQFYKARQDDLEKLRTVIEDAPRYMRQRIVVAHRLRQKWGFLIVKDEAKFQRRVDKYVSGNIGKLVSVWESVRIQGYKGTTTGGKLHFKKMLDDGLTLEDHKQPGKDALYLTNGQHRCVVLLAMGKSTIPETWYAVKTVRQFRPIETTHEYIKRGWLSEKEFIRFARLRFPTIPTEIINIQDFRRWAADLPRWLHYYLDIYWGEQ